MRYAYSVTSALLVGGAAISLATGYPAGAQVAQNEGLQAAAPAGAPASLADMVEKLQPAVVNISTKQRVQVQNPFAGTPFGNLFGFGQGQPQTRQAQSLGSGFIISADGYVVTNNHVVSPTGRGTVEEITVTMPDGTEYNAELVGTDPQSDLAVLKISRGAAFPYVEFGDSSQARPGDWVVAIGNPFGLGGTVTAGIISARGRDINSGPYDDFIQTDASINPGNSGGPLVNIYGEVIGINTLIRGVNTGIGFAIPVNLAKRVADMLIEDGKVTRAWLGVSITTLREDADYRDLAVGVEDGVVVRQFVPGGPAENSDLELADVITTVDGNSVTTADELKRELRLKKAGDSVTLGLMRNGKAEEIDQGWHRT